MKKTVANFTSNDVDIDIANTSPIKKERLKLADDGYVLGVLPQIIKSPIATNKQQKNYDYDSDSSESESELLKPAPIEIKSPTCIKKLKQKPIIPVNTAVHATSIITAMRSSQNTSSKNKSPNKNIIDTFIDFNKDVDKEDDDENDTTIGDFDNLVATKALDIRGMSFIISLIYVFI
jgi:hypothetical protein